MQNAPRVTAVASHDWQCLEFGNSTSGAAHLIQANLNPGLPKNPCSASSGTPETFVLEMTKSDIIPGKDDIIVNSGTGQCFFHRRLGNLSA